MRERERESEKLQKYDCCVYRGERVCLLVDTSSQCSSPENQGEEEDGQLGCGTRESEGGEGEEMEKFRHHLKQLFDEQLLHKSKVYLLKLDSDGSPTPLNLRKHRERLNTSQQCLCMCVQYACVCSGVPWWLESGWKGSETKENAVCCLVWRKH